MRARGSSTPRTWRCRGYGDPQRLASFMPASVGGQTIYAGWLGFGSWQGARENHAFLGSCAKGPLYDSQTGAGG